MSRTFRALSLIAVAMLISLCARAADPVQTVKLSVNGMVCSFCAQGIEKRISALPEAGPLYINLAQKVVAVQAKPGQQIDVARLKAEIVEAGYEVREAQTVSESVAQIRASLQAKK
jgi:periplasmic mercuric ion binding protein